MTSKRKLKTDAAWTAGYLQGLTHAEIITGRPFDPAPWQTHLARATDLARKQGYEYGHQVGSETCTHAGRGAKIPLSPSQPVAVPQQGSDPERGSEPENPEWLTTGDEYRAVPVGTVVADQRGLMEKNARGMWEFVSARNYGNGHTNGVMALTTRRVIRWGQE